MPVNEEKQPTPREVWQQLSTTDVSAHVEKKSNLSYLSWAWAWGILMANYPDASFEFERGAGNDEHIELRGGSVEVRCSITIGGMTRKMWLPVMDHKNKAIIDPDAFEINKAKMRCLVKCLALFGLGFNIYAGEDLPSSEPPERSRTRPASSSRPERPANRERTPAREDRAAPARPSSSLNPTIEDLIAEVKAAPDAATLRVVYTRNANYLSNRGMTEEAAQLLAARLERKAQLDGAA